MSFENTTAYLSKGTRFQIGSTDLKGVQTISGLGSGGAVEIDITKLDSTATEYALGLPDEGSITLDGVIAFQHPLTQTLQNARNDGSEISCSIYVGGVPAGENRTDGSGVITVNDATVAAALVSTKRVYTTDANAVTFPAISEGDYVKDKPTGGGAATFHKITKLAVASEKLAITTDATTNSTSTKIDVVRPAIRMTFNGRVSSFDRSASTNEVWRFSLTIRITGSVTTTVGSPDVTVT